MLNIQSAEELAGYILETGDEASVITLLEGLIKDGQISEEEALIFVETLKSYIEEAEASPVEPEDEEIREHLLERKFEEEKAARAADRVAMLQSLGDNVPTSEYKMEYVLSSKLLNYLVYLIPLWRKHSSYATNDAKGPPSQPKLTNKNQVIKRFNSLTGC